MYAKHLPSGHCSSSGGNHRSSTTDFSGYCFQYTLQPGGHWEATLKEYPVVVTRGESLEEVEALLRGALETLKRHGLIFPPPDAYNNTMDIHNILVSRATTTRTNRPLMTLSFNNHCPGNTD